MNDRPAPTRLPPVGVVVSRYNQTVTSRLLAGATEEYARRGGAAESLVVAEAPGSFELPVVALALARSGRVRAVAALGCIIRGGTDHHRYLGDAVAQGLQDAALRSGVPVAFGVLTADTPREALDRAGGPMGNKGAEAMAAALDAAAAIDRIAHGDAEEPPGAAPRPGAAVRDKARGLA